MCFKREESLCSVKKKKKTLWEASTNFLVLAPQNGRNIAIPHLVFMQNISKRTQRADKKIETIVNKNKFSK